MERDTEKENLITSTTPLGQFTQKTLMQQLKRSNSSLSKNSRLALASKDRNRLQNVFHVKQQILQGQGGNLSSKGEENTSRWKDSNNLVKNIPENKLKKNVSVPNVSYLNSTKSNFLILKDAGDKAESGEEDINRLGAKLKSRSISSLEEESEESGSKEVDGSGGLKKLHRFLDDRSDGLSDIEYAPKRHPELPHVPNGHEEFSNDDIDKIAGFQSNLAMLDEDSSEGETGANEQGLPIDFESIDGSTALEEEQAKIGHESFNKLRVFAQDPDFQSKLEFEFNVGEGLTSEEMQSLLD